MKRFRMVDDYIENAEYWQDELRQLRKILLSTALEETVKWGGPCYMHGGKNIVGLGSFKSYVGLWFHQGALLSDPNQVLINAQEGKTKALRQWRIHSKKQIKARLIKSYVKEAIELQQQGREIKPVRAKPMVVPPELGDALAANEKARAAFETLTKGKQREYADYIAEAKRKSTRLSRTEKVVPMVLAGKGLNDKYRRRSSN